TGSRGVRVRVMAAGKGARRRRGECIVRLEPVGAHPRRTVLRTKSLAPILAEAAREGEGGALKRVLGPLHLVALGVGAVIGTGIFATIGTASAGDANRPGAGPALTLSFLLTALVRTFT